MTATILTPDEPFDSRHNITPKEIDRDLLKLNLREIDLIVSEGECDAMYPPGAYQRMMREITGQDEAPHSSGAA